MRLGVQRRHIYLAPPEGLDRYWFVQQFNRNDIYPMFGFPEPAGMQMAARLADGELVVGMIRLVANRARIGFVLMFPPGGDVEFWEFGYAITSPKYRDAYAAINAMDAMAHYMFDHVKVPLCGGRTRDDNAAAEAIPRRLGYRQIRTAEHGGHTYRIYTLDPAGWARRKARLESGELMRPSAGGAALVVLPAPPFHPVLQPPPAGGAESP
ncbi:MAG: GNAT family N-acetyltransferase [Deltaproteobacteria bacterium]|nr:GNAT family N-acetyltransferase [Deltaproteobacteria bacterium]